MSSAAIDHLVGSGAGTAGAGAGTAGEASEAGNGGGSSRERIESIDIG